MTLITLCTVIEKDYQNGVFPWVEKCQLTSMDAIPQYNIENFENLMNERKLCVL